VLAITQLSRLPVPLCIGLFVSWLITWKAARYGYKYHLSIKLTAVVMLAHGIVITGIGYLMWPRVTVSPAHVSFQGYENETFNFSVRNGRGDDVYEVHIPFLIGYNKHFQDKLSVKVTPNGDPSQDPLRNKYFYCFGYKGDGDVRKVQPNEREVLIVNIPHMAPYSSGSFSVTYSGGEKFETRAGTSDFIEEPYSYSPSQGTVDVRGDYRICKVNMSAVRP